MKSVKERRYKCSFCRHEVVLEGSVSNNAIRIGSGEEEVVYCLRCIDRQFISGFKMKEVIPKERKINGDKCINKIKEEEKKDG